MGLLTMGGERPMFATVLLAAALGAPACWDIYDGALRHRAAAAHPAYVSYDERQQLIDDNFLLVSSSAHVEYRDDGVARVMDTRFNNEPFVTRRADPGPPELGPYGKDRESWLPVDELQMPLRVIGDVRAHGDIQCVLAGSEVYKGHNTYHLVFQNTPRDRPAVKAMWVDTRSKDIWKLVVSGFVVFTDMETPPLTDFEVELRYAGPYLVVDHVTWKYRLREYSQYDNLFGEYYFTGFDFPPSLPDSLFAQGTAGGETLKKN
ncbi:MAG TPA: hypothetical protein VIG51_09430 [Candidatus Baltobacteraceae bacterium]|jgi:hypothetical protein